MIALLSGKRPRGRPRTCWQNYVEDLACSHVGTPLAKLPLVAGDCWNSEGCLEIPTRAALPATSKGQTGKGKYIELIYFFPENDDNNELSKDNQNTKNQIFLSPNFHIIVISSSYSNLYAYKRSISIKLFKLIKKDKSVLVSKSAITLTATSFGIQLFISIRS